MKFSKGQKKRLYSVIAGAVLFFAGAVLSFSELKLAASVCFMASAVAAGWLCVVKAFAGIMRGDFFDENTLMTIAAAGAVIIGEYPECAAVMVLYQVGELFQSVAVGKSRKAIRELTKLFPDTAHIEQNGEISDISPSELSAGNIIVIRPGERIPADCTVLSGNSSVDTSPVTGESLPADVTPGKEVYSGCVNLTGLIRAEVISAAEESTAGRILHLTGEASDRKTKSEAFITRFAKIYTPAVALLAAIIALGVPLIIMLANGTPYSESIVPWSRRALSMLVISCPCALVISVPLGYFCGLGNASKKGILIKGSAFVDALANADIAVFDKTGTLTEGVLSVTDIRSELERTELLKLAATAEKNSSHPIAKAICAAAGEAYDVISVTETSGHGVEAVLTDGRTVRAEKPSCPPADFAGTVVEISVDREKKGLILLSDTIKDTTPSALRELRRLGIKKTVMLTGDSENSAAAIAGMSGVDEYKSGFLPEDKYAYIEKLCDEGRVMYAGDGINDSPSLARADVGIAMGAMGAGAAIEAADAVLMTGNLCRLADAVKLSKRTVFTVKTNIVISLAVKAAVLILAAFGLVGMWAAVAADVGVCIVCVTNSMRMLK